MSCDNASLRERARTSQLRTKPPRYAKTQTFKELQAYWYGKLKRTRFNEDGKPDPKGEPFRDLDPQNKADRMGVLLMNTDRGPRIGKLRRSRFVSFSQVAPLQSEQEMDELEHVMAESAKTFALDHNIADTPTARAWRAISRQAHDLPADYKHRAFLIDLAQVGTVAEYLLRRHKLTRRRAIWAFDKFLLEHGMGDFHGLLVRGPVRPR